MKCLCGSGKFAKNCHGTQYTKDKMRSHIKYEILGIDPSGEVSINANFKPQGFGKQTTKCILKYWIADTPAGRLIYPLLLQKEKKSIRPITVDGLHFDKQDNEIIQYIQCMLTPVCRAVIKLETKQLKLCKNGYVECECLVECDGNPFESIYAIETKNGLIKLYHHTSEINANLIHESSIIKGSKWNLQGTEELTHCHFIYFTDLYRINDIFDLIEIGMADKGTTTKLCTDDGKLIEEFEVYREEAGNRTHTLSIWVDPELISPPPLILHEPNTFSGSDYSWWEIFHNSIFRVPVKLNSSLPLKHIEEHEYILETNENLIPGEGFLAGHGMDMVSMRILLSEPKPENHPRKDNLTDADIGNLDDFWVETWGKKFVRFGSENTTKFIAKKPLTMVYSRPQAARFFK